MLELFADCLLLATRIPPTDPRARALRDRKGEDEAWLQERRAGRFDGRKR